MAKVFACQTRGPGLIPHMGTVGTKESAKKMKSNGSFILPNVKKPNSCPVVINTNKFIKKNLKFLFYLSNSLIIFVKGKNNIFMIFEIFYFLSLPT